MTEDHHLILLKHELAIFATWLFFSEESVRMDASWSPAQSVAIILTKIILKSDIYLNSFLTSSFKFGLCQVKDSAYSNHTALSSIHLCLCYTCQFRISMPHTVGTAIKRYNSVIARSMCESSEADPQRFVRSRSILKRWRETEVVDKISLYCKVAELL
jgi:hypothetical protein